MHGYLTYRNGNDSKRFDYMLIEKRCSSPTKQCAVADVCDTGSDHRLTLCTIRVENQPTDGRNKTLCVQLYCHIRRCIEWSDCCFACAPRND
eukprot:2002120-Karenia_brevis.AAC.1